MNKKQRNRKLIIQNRRNRIINRKYSSTIKTLFKLFLEKTKNVKIETFNENQKVENRSKLITLVNNLYSVIDKAMKKSVIHKNTAARKKSRISRINKLFLNT
jgi:small subunit ribosomal protein S20